MPFMLGRYYYLSWTLESLGLNHQICSVLTDILRSLAEWPWPSGFSDPYYQVEKLVDLSPFDLDVAPLAMPSSSSANCSSFSKAFSAIVKVCEKSVKEPLKLKRKVLDNLRRNFERLLLRGGGAPSVPKLLKWLIANHV